MNPDEDGRPISDGQWADLERMIENGGQLWVTSSKPGRNGITRRTANAIADRGLVTVTESRAIITDAGRRAVEHHRTITGRHPQ